MLYIKVLHNGTIIGAEAHEDPVYVNHPYYRETPVRCEKNEAQGVVSLDQSQIYHLLNRSSMPGEHLEAEVISKEEYEYIIERLGPDDDPEPEPAPDEQDDYMTIPQMRERILALETENEFLTDCLLEMSEVVYAGD